MTSFFRVNENCNGCLACVRNCPAGALKYTDEGDHRTIFHNMTLCARCGHCHRVCPENAVEFRHLLDGPWDKVTSLELARCEICGEPVYTVPYADTLGRRLPERPATRCRHHKNDEVVKAWKPYRAAVYTKPEADRS
ncbi:MAG TPA: 4Fe-4S dicluster domain-containing protein [Desulfobacteraceae bacterium]|nr:4Fe-4S dicluster domain-containing protein [Desulfobacteraceae bacterium]